LQFVLPQEVILAAPALAERLERLFTTAV